MIPLERRGVIVGQIPRRFLCTFWMLKLFGTGH
jgi:hypothetical protein